MKALLLRVGLLAAAAAGPAAFPLAQMGYTSLSRLALLLILPSAALLISAPFVLRTLGLHRLGSALGRGLLAGALATVALEAVRYSGFRLGFMPGNLPELMGVLLLDRFALGPSAASHVAGFAYHYYNGAAFGAIFALLTAGRSRWWAIPYGVAIGLGFLASPVVQSLGVGLFGKDFGWRFAATVITAHAAYGAVLGAANGRPLRPLPIGLFALKAGPYGAAANPPCAKMRIEILYFDGCPNHRATVERTRQILAEESVPAQILELNVPDEASAQAYEFLGSPTVRIDGLDIEPEARSSKAFGLTCRTYLETGKRVGVPPRDLIRRAVREAAGGTRCGRDC